MSFRAAAWLPYLLIVLWAGSLPAYGDPIVGISFNAPVIDKADMLTDNEERMISQLLYAARRQGGPHIGVLTIPSLEGDSIEGVSIRIADAWALGGEKEDNGIILLIARDERRMRIEVGQGLEGDLPDAYARRIIDNHLTPAFQQGQYGNGVIRAVAEIIQRTFPEFDITSASEGYPRGFAAAQDSEPESLIGRIVRFIVMALAMFFLLGTPVGRLILFSLLLSGGRGGSRGRGGFGGGGFGGGGFGGGGGGFSGGGASGGW